MPRSVDTSYHELLSRPDFYDENQREEYMQKQIMDEILEPKIPPLPNRQQELDYIKGLEQEFREDRWLHSRFRKLQAGPLRRPYIKTRALKQRYRMEYITHFALGAFLFTPLAIFIGRRCRITRNGIAKIYFPVNYHRFPNVNPDVYASRYFRIGFYATLFIGGNLFASILTPDPFKDEYYSRSDFKPSAPMVEDTDEIKKAKKEL